MCIYFTSSLLLLYWFLGVITVTFHDSARSAQLKWAMSGTRHSRPTYSRFSHVRHCSPQVHVTQSKIFALLQAGLQANDVLDTVDCYILAPTKKYLTTTTRTKPCVDKGKVPIPRRGDAPPTQQWCPPRRADPPLTPLPRSEDSPDARPTDPRPSHAAVTRLPRSVAAAMTPCWRSSHAAMTQLPRRADAPLMPHWRPLCPYHAAMTPAANGGGQGGPGGCGVVGCGAGWDGRPRVAGWGAVWRAGWWGGGQGG